MIGLFAILLLYVVLFQRGMKIATAAKDGFGTLFAAGISFTIALQCFIVIGGVTRLIPLTGLTTPFLAAGGSSLIANWIIIGLLLRISDNARRPQEEFATGVLPTYAADDDDSTSSRTAPARTGANPTGTPATGHGTGAVSPDEAPTEAHRAVRTDSSVRTDEGGRA